MRKINNNLNAKDDANVLGHDMLKLLVMQC